MKSATFRIGAVVLASQFATMARFTNVVIAYLAAPAAFAQQWTAVVLHPSGMAGSSAYAVNATRQAGQCALPGAGGTQGGLWAGTSGSWTSFNPAGSTMGAIVGLDDHYQIGGIQLPPVHASLWAGSAESRIDLQPAGPDSSSGNATVGGMQVGTLFFPFSVPHAALWRGTAASCVDLHPPGAEQSYGTATDGALQGGWVIWAVQTPIATIWNGTPQSAVSLMPGTWSKVTGMAPGVQVGWIDVPGARKAALWRGSSASYTDLSPPGNDTAYFLATTGSVHVGAYAQSGLGRAGVNFGSPTSWVSLHQFLSAPYFSFSEATCVFQSGNTIYVGGWAENSNTSRQNAILWIGTLPCYANCDLSTATPVLNVADFTCFLQRFAAGDMYANCDNSPTPPVLNVNDFTCFLTRYAAGCL